LKKLIEKLMDFISVLFKRDKERPEIEVQQKPDYVYGLITDKKGGFWLEGAEKPNLLLKTRGNYKHSTHRGLPTFLTLHYTAGRGKAIDTLIRAQANGYAFLMIDKPTGKLFQAHPLNRWGSHSGKSEYLYEGKKLKWLSNRSLGIEVGCAGRLSGVYDNGKMRYLDTPDRVEKYTGEVYPWYAFNPTTKLLLGNAKPIPKSRTRKIIFPEFNRQPGFYEKFTAAQEKTLEDFILWYASIKPDFDPLLHLLSHDIISPDRKSDVGGSLSLPLDEYRIKIANKIKEQRGF